MNAIPDSIESYEKKVETFFDEAKSFELNAHGTLRDYRETFDRFFSEDQLRCVLAAKFSCAFFFAVNEESCAKA